MCGPGLAGSTVGIVGTGLVGQAIGQRLKPFQVRKLLYSGQNPKPGEETLPSENGKLKKQCIDNYEVIMLL